MLTLFLTPELSLPTAMYRSYTAYYTSRILSGTKNPHWHNLIAQTGKADKTMAITY